MSNVSIVRAQSWSVLPIVIGTLFAGACDAPEQEMLVQEEVSTAVPTAVEFRSAAPAPVDDQNDLASYIAQCESVLGKIPQISCDPENPAPGTKVTKIPVFVDGLLLGFDEDLTAEEQEILAQRAMDSDYSCDFPSIGGDFSCAVGSTLVQYQSEENPNVQWVGLCRGVGEDNPGYDRFIGNGLIGANEKTGEMCFFFGSNPNPQEPYELPALSSEQAADAMSPWLPPREMPGSCISCHPNNDPWVLTPWVQPTYMKTTLTNPAYPLELGGVELEETLAARFIKETPTKYKTKLPTPLPEGRTAWTEEEIFGPEGELVHRQYRPVGSSYVDAEAKGEVRPRTGMKPESWSVNFRDRLRLQEPSSSCANGCHALANEHTLVLAKDSMGTKYASKYLSNLMSDADAPGQGWMPSFGGDLEHWKGMFKDTDFTIPAITECPIPKQVDSTPDTQVMCNEDGSGAVIVEWDYINDYGDVPGRDDVRFDVAFGNGQTPVSSTSAHSDSEGTIMTESAGNTLLRDLAPEPGTASYRLAIPFTGDQDTLTLDLQPKRFCFEEPDRRPFAYAPARHLEIDLTTCR